MQIGVVLPQGWTGEFTGISAPAAWERLLAVAREAEQEGFESVWTFDHYLPFVADAAPVAKPFMPDVVVTERHQQVVPATDPSEHITFESFITLAAVAAHTRRVRLGHLVMCASFRNPALAAKMVSTLDVFSGGRMEMALGAGWKEDEFRAYGYGFPPLADRMGTLRDSLEIITRMFAHGPASFVGAYARVEGAVNLPRGLQEPRIPVTVGGNGPNVTWRLAAQFCDEVNLDSLTPAEVAEALPVIRDRCREIGRDPDTLKVSVHVWWEYTPGPGHDRVAMLAAYRDLGIARVMLFVRECASDPQALELLALDARAAGIELAPRLTHE